MTSLFKKWNITHSKTKELFSKSNDYHTVQYINEKTKITFQLTFVTTLIDNTIIQEQALPYLLEEEFRTMDDLKKILPISDVEITDDLTKIEQKLLNGYVMISLENKPYPICFFAAQSEKIRNVSLPEVEFSVIGPKEAFIENLHANLNLIRKRLPIKELVVDQVEVGELSKTKVAILHIEGITNSEDMNTVKQRIEDIKIDVIGDSSYLVQILSDHQHSIFPQILDTERPDRVVGALSEGKVVVIVDGSPQALVMPTNLVEFFNSFEDYFQNWIIASCIRLIRLFSVLFSLFVTPIYVAVLTFHYQLIPQDLLGILVTSRRDIPFPPILEAIFLEVTIELLREAGARLPTKVGQTIGIVGGIVLGTASVEAGLTSNVLLIFVALAALASFTTPIYRIGNTIRLLRFPFLLFANLWGFLGISICFCFVLTHLYKLTSIGRPFMEPIYPPRVEDLKDSFIRLPFHEQARRPFFLRTKEPYRMDPKQVKVKKDIDE